MSITEENKELVQRIRLCCQSIGITVKDLEKELGFPNGTIGKWASAAKRPPFERVNAVADYFGYTVSFLRGESEKPTPGDGDGLSAEARAAAVMFDRAEPWVRDQVLSLLRAAELAHAAQDDDSKDR